MIDELDTPPFPEGVWDVWAAFGLANIEDWLTTWDARLPFAQVVAVHGGGSRRPAPTAGTSSVPRWYQ